MNLMKKVNNRTAGVAVSSPLLGLLTALGIGFLGIHHCHAGAAGVIDNGGFFSEQAKSDADKTIGEIERTLHKDLLIETFKEIPAKVKGDANLSDKTVVAKVCEQWAEARAKEKTVNGVYVLIVKDPAHLQALVGNDTQRQAFTLRNRDELATLMLKELRAHRPDDALRGGVDYVAATMKSHAGAHPRTGAAPSAASHRSSGLLGWVCPLIAVLIVLWIVIGLVRSVFGGARGGMAVGPAGSPYGYGGGGGGGFLSSLFGGMFGAAAGMWMYDRFFGGHESQSGTESGGYASGDDGFTGQDTDYSGTGGDFGGGDSSDGGDFGGGDSSSGGGDF